MATKIETCVTIDDIDEYTNFEKSIETFENNSHYSSIMCFKNTIYGPSHDNTKDVFMASVKKMSGRTDLKYKCVLPLGHLGKCCHKFSTLFKKNSFTKKLLSSVDSAITHQAMMTMSIKTGVQDYMKMLFLPYKKKVLEIKKRRKNALFL